MFGIGFIFLFFWYWVDVEWMRNKIRKMENEMFVVVLENIVLCFFIRI